MSTTDNDAFIKYPKLGDLFGILSDIGGLWSSLQEIAIVFVYLLTNQSFIQMIIGKLYLTKRDAENEEIC
jgi:hypothetical protein